MQRKGKRKKMVMVMKSPPLAKGRQRQQQHDGHSTVEDANTMPILILPTIL